MIEHVAYDYQGQYGDGVPLVMGEELDEVGLEHAWGGHEEPVGRVDDFHVAFMV